MYEKDNKTAKQQKGRLRTRTFVFAISDMETGSGNSTLEAFCEAHNVLSVVFNESKGKLIYVLIYKD
jgi:hypothetical protein